MSGRATTAKRRLRVPLLFVVLDGLGKSWRGEIGQANTEKRLNRDSKIKALSRKARQVIACTSFFGETGYRRCEISRAEPADFRRLRRAFARRIDAARARPFPPP
jgi:hypothetical protein